MRLTTPLRRLSRRHDYDRRKSQAPRDQMVEWVLARLRGQQTIRGLLALGLNSSGDFYMASNTYIDAAFAWAVTVEDRVIISHDVQIIAHDAAAKRLVGYTRVSPVVIRSRAYIGAGSMILPGVTVGEGAVVGAGAVVTRDVEPGTVVVGSPARRVTDTEALGARVRQEMLTAPVFEHGGITSDGEKLRALRSALDAHGTIYVV